MTDGILIYLAEGFRFLVQSYWGVLFFTLLGIYYIRNAVKEHTITSNNLRGWAAGIGSVIVTLLILYFKLIGEI